MKDGMDAVEVTELDAIEVEAVAGGAPGEDGDFYGEQVKPW